MASATAVSPPATNPDYRKALEPSGPLARSASASATTAATTAATGVVSTDAAAADAAISSRGSRRVSVILHGKRADEVDVRAAVAALRSEGLRVDVKVTWESGDVEKFVKDIVKAHSADTIVAAGGDGTLNEVVAALIKVKAPRHVAVGLMPMGTSNDFAAVTGIPQDLEAALRLCCRSDNLRPLDVGLLNGEVFMNTATLGASSELGAETSHEAKKLLGPAAYLVKGVARLAGYAAVPVKMRFPAAPEEHPPGALPRTSSAAAPGINEAKGAPPGEAAAAAATAPPAATSAEVPPEQPLEQRRLEPQVTLGKADKRDRGKGGGGSWKKTVELHAPVLNLTAGNSRQLASMVQACPDALLDDGLLDITYVTGGAVESATALVGEILTRGLDAAQPANVHSLRVPWLEVEVEAEDTALQWPGNRDGEPVPPGRSFLLEALPRRVTMHLPDSCRPLLTEGADPRVNAPVIAINRMRKGMVKAMLAQVRRFKRIIPGSRPWWQGMALGLLARAPLVLLGFAAGYAVASRRVRSSGAAEQGKAAATRSGTAKDKKKGKQGTSGRGEGKGSGEKERGSESGDGVGRRVRAILPWWPTRKEVGVAV